MNLADLTTIFLILLIAILTLTMSDQLTIHRSYEKVVPTSESSLIQREGNQSGRSQTNQTTDTKSNTAIDLSREELDPILTNLFNARDELRRSNGTSALHELGEASTIVYQISLKKVGDGKGQVSEQLRPLLNYIEWARDSLLNNNNYTSAIINLNSADTEFIKLTQANFS